jgi:hypothetical protein
LHVQEFVAVATAEAITGKVVIPDRSKVNVNVNVNVNINILILVILLLLMAVWSASASASTLSSLSTMERSFLFDE